MDAASATRVAAQRHETIVPVGNLYIPSLDGIRAVSILLVFVAHAGMGDVVPGGLGVSIFFLLSGFLITTLLRLEFANSHTISLRSFYLRRVLRILPPMYVTLLFAILIYCLSKGVHAFPIAGTVAQALQMSNYYQIYANHAREIPGSGVLWSLAVEEHFYLVFPVLFLWLSNKFTPSRQAMVLSALCILALAWRCVLHFYFGSASVRTYYGSDTRFDSILFGCILAIIANPVLKDRWHLWLLRQMKWMLPTAFGALAVSLLFRSEGFRETLRYTVQALALMPLFAAAIHYQGAMAVRLLNLPWVRFIGVLSYALYLCHHLILEFIGRAWSVGPVATGIIALAASLCFAVAVHYLIERPATRLRKRLSKTQLR